MAKSPRGGWTRKTLAAWGVPWPPPKGWRKALVEGKPVKRHAPPAAKKCCPTCGRPFARSKSPAAVAARQMDEEYRLIMEDE